MKILLVSSDFYGQIGGKSTHILMLMKGLEKIGHKVELLVPNSNFIIRVMVGGLGKVFDLFHMGILARHFLFRLLLRASVLMKLKEEQIDVINAEDPDALLACYGLSEHAPLVLTIHGELAKELKAAGHVKYPFENEQFLKLEKKTYEIADIIVAVDSRIKEHVVTIVPGGARKVRMIYNFLDVISFEREINSLNALDIKKEFGVKEDRKIILVPRRLMVKSGVIFAVKATGILVKEYKRNDIMLLVTGGGPEYNKLVAYVNDSGLKDFVVFKDNVQYSVMPKFYKISSIVLIPSINVEGYKEATSLSAIEAMAAKIPVIASNIGGLAELIQNNKTGILVPEKSPEDIAKNIALILDNHSLRNRITEEGFNYILKRHNYEKATEEFVKIYKEVMTAK